MDLQPIRDALALAREIDELKDASLREMLTEQLKAALSPLRFPVVDLGTEPDRPNGIKTPWAPVSEAPQVKVRYHKKPALAKSLARTRADNRQVRVLHLVNTYATRVAPVSCTDLLEVADPQDRLALSNTLSRLAANNLINRTRVQDTDALSREQALWKYWPKERNDDA